mmetsp:Transcript_68445/g.205040  ORF Transcript_68445/g.205040 Transcript_68445/m.205040 type:complete len:252 (+) Transcript_68445:102-857(+)
MHAGTPPSPFLSGHTGVVACPAAASRPRQASRGAMRRPCSPRPSSSKQRSSSSRASPMITATSSHRPTSGACRSARDSTSATTTSTIMSPRAPSDEARVIRLRVGGGRGGVRGTRRCVVGWQGVARSLRARCAVRRVPSGRRGPARVVAWWRGDALFGRRGVCGDARPVGRAPRWIRRIAYSRCGVGGRRVCVCRCAGRPLVLSAWSFISGSVAGVCSRTRPRGGHTQHHVHVHARSVGAHLDQYQAVCAL